VAAVSVGSGVRDGIGHLLSASSWAAPRLHDQHRMRGIRDGNVFAPQTPARRADVAVHVLHGGIVGIGTCPLSRSRAPAIWAGHALSDAITVPRPHPAVKGPIVT